MNKTISTELWADFSPTQEPTDISLAKSQNENGIVIEQIYFTGRTIKEGQKSRVFATVAYKEKNTQAILVVQPPQDKIDVDCLKKFAERGFIAMSVDFFGEQLNGEKFTVYPSGIEYANYKKGGRHLTHADVSVKQTCWYEYSISVMRAVTVLLEQYCASNVSLLSVKEGSRMAIHAIAVDKRPLTAIITFGKLRENWQDDEAETEEADVKAQLMQVEEQERWLLGICPQSYLPQIEAPIYVVEGGNCGYIDTENHAALLMCSNENSRYVIFPECTGKITHRMRKSICQWIELCRENAEPMVEPKLSYTARNGKLCVGVKSKADLIETYYVRSGPARAFNWIKAESQLRETGALAELELKDAREHVGVFASAYSDGLWLSSSAEFIVPQKQFEEENFKTIKGGKLIYQSGHGEEQFVPVQLGESINAETSEISVSKGAMDIKGVSGSHFGTFVLSEKLLVFSSDSVLMLDVYSKAKQTLTVSVVTNWADENQKIFIKTVELCGGEFWQKISISLNSMKSAEGESLQQQDKAQLLAFDAESDVTVNNLLFS